MKHWLSTPSPSYSQPAGALVSEESEVLVVSEMSLVSEVPVASEVPEVSDLMMSSLPLLPPPPPLVPIISYSAMSVLQQSCPKVQRLLQSSALKVVSVPVSGSPGFTL